MQTDAQQREDLRAHMEAATDTTFAMGRQPLRKIIVALLDALDAAVAERDQQRERAEVAEAALSYITGECAQRGIALEMTVTQYLSTARMILGLPEVTSDGK